jgi:polyisoprenyl-phosphate glycosyltransferase
MSKIVSIVTPFYNEEDGIDAYFEHLLPILETLKYDYEIVCIDDGSRDDTFTLLKQWREKNSRIKVAKLSRNFGKEAALTAGLEISRGDAAIPIDADLQDSPELIPQMVAKWEEGFDVVLMKRKSRDESWHKKLTAYLFYRVINLLSAGNVPENIGDFRLMDRKVIATINNLNEKSRFMKGLLTWPGFTTTTLLYNRPDRTTGVTQQNWGNLFRLAFDGIFAFSTFPLRIWTFIGLFVTLVAFCFGAVLATRKILYGNPVPGYPSLMTAILLLNGLLMINMGLLGEYVSRIFDEVKNRPIYVIDKLLKDDQDGDI